jgi:transcription elongation factor GreA-like protein
LVTLHAVQRSVLLVKLMTIVSTALVIAIAVNVVVADALQLTSMAGRAWAHARTHCMQGTSSVFDLWRRLVRFDGNDLKFD